MKTLISIFLTFNCLVLLATESKIVTLRYSIDSIHKDPKLLNNQSQFQFMFRNYPLPEESREFYYSTGKHEKENLVGRMDEQNKFNLNLESGTYRFKFYHSDTYYEITTDSIPIESQTVMYISLYFEVASEMIIVDKPVIYLYPTIPAIVDIQVKAKGELTFTYPKYNNGWKVKAEPSGELTIDEKPYNYLFWESSQMMHKTFNSFKEGFVVEKENTLAFLEEKLTKFGLSSKEQADFITYWGPLLIKNPKNFIHFVMNEKCEQFASLEITPKPDHIYRIYILTFPLSAGSDPIVKEQVLPEIDRAGFTVIEWGGSQISEKIMTKLF